MFIILGVLAAVALIFVIRKKEIVSHDPLAGAAAPPTIPANPNATAADLFAIVSLIKEGKNIEAIKQYRELTGSSLTEAKVTLDRMVSFKVVPKNPADAGALEAVHALVRQGKTLDAIKLFRETFGVGLKEAKEAVDAMTPPGQ